MHHRSVSALCMLGCHAHCCVRGTTKLGYVNKPVQVVPTMERANDKPWSTQVEEEHRASLPFVSVYELSILRDNMHGRILSILTARLHLSIIFTWPCDTALPLVLLS